MSNELKGQFAGRAALSRDASRPRLVDRYLSWIMAAGVMTIPVLGGIAAADDDDRHGDRGSGAAELRRFVDHQVGGIENLMVPAQDADLPQPRLADGSPDPVFEITEAKRYLGKQLFHDPVRTARILPEFGGVPATKQTASCASCHIGEAASK